MTAIHPIQLIYLLLRHYGYMTVTSAHPIYGGGADGTLALRSTSYMRRLAPISTY